MSVGERERRVTHGSVRATGRRGIAGLGIPVGVRADIGPFTEEITPEAVRHAAAQAWDVRGLFNHDVNMILGKTGSGTMTVTAAKDGLRYEIPELPASRADVLEAIERRDVDGNSFSFTVDVDEWDRSEDLPKPHRVIKQFEQLYDVGPVTYPAYEGMTVVSARSMEQARALARSGGRCPGPGCDPSYRAAPRRLTLADRRRQLRSVKADLAREPELLPAPGRWGESIRGLLLHEAAHAVVATVLHVPVACVRLKWDRRGQPSGGACAHHGHADQVPAVVYLAGPLAERWADPRFTRLTLNNWVEEGRKAGITDVIRATARVARAGWDRPGTPRDLMAAVRETEHTLRECWPAVETLADRMAEAPGGFVEGDEIRRLAREHGARWLPGQ